MEPIEPQPRVKLSKLRDIGWTLWDPIGLLGPLGSPFGVWSEEDHLSFAGEYDRYLVSAASQIRRGEAEDVVVAYLQGVEMNYMGLGRARDTWKRAAAVVKAIRSEKDLWTWPDAQGRFP